MPEQHQSSPEIQFVPLSPEQAELLLREPDAIRHMGYVAMGGAEIIGVVPETENAPAHFVNLNENDPGTRINVTNNTAKAQENYEKYGSPDAAVERLYAEAPADSEADRGSSLAQIAEQAGLPNILRRFNDLESMIRGDNRLNSEDIYSMMGEIDRLSYTLDAAAQSGPWAGNYMRNYPEILGSIDAMTASMSQQVERIKTRTDSREHEVARYAQDVNTTGSEVALSVEDANERTKYDQALQQVSGTLQQIGRAAEGTIVANDIKNRVLGQLSNIRFSHELTVHDVFDMAMQMKAVLSSAEAQLLDTRAMTLLGEQINELDGLLQEKA